jgi:arginine decarboxylase
MFRPQKVFFTKGVGRHKDYLQSFELALRSAGVERCNLVNVLSILPPRCRRITATDGMKLLEPGSLTFVVMARNVTNEPNRLVAASIGAAQLADESAYGYLSEHHSFGEKDERAGEYAEDLAATMLATTLGVEFDQAVDWDDRENSCKMSGKILKTFKITQSAEGDKDGRWTSVVAMAVLLP